MKLKIKNRKLILLTVQGVRQNVSLKNRLTQSAQNTVSRFIFRCDFCHALRLFLSEFALTVSPYERWDKSIIKIWWDICLTKRQSDFVLPILSRYAVFQRRVSPRRLQRMGSIADPTVPYAIHAGLARAIPALCPPASSELGESIANSDIPIGHFQCVQGEKWKKKMASLGLFFAKCRPLGSRQPVLNTSSGSYELRQQILVARLLLTKNSLFRFKKLVCNNLKNKTKKKRYFEPSLKI